MKAKKTGLIIFWIGAVYMLGMGFVATWWVNSAYRSLSPAQMSETIWAPGSSLFTLWAISVPLGSILAAIGMVLYVQTKGSRMWSFVIGGALVILWLYFWKTYNPTIYPTIFGVLGGLLLVFFLATLWYWAKKRTMLEGPAKTAADFQLVSYVFFLIAAWGICSLLAAPYFLLRPDKMLQFFPLQSVHSMGALVMMCLVLGWLFTFLSQYKTR